MRAGRFAAMVLVVAWSAAALADGVDTSNPNLPPDQGEYITGAGPYYPLGGALLVLQEIHLKPLAATALRTNFGADEREQFSATMNGMAAHANPIGLETPFPYTSSGPEDTLTFGKVGNTTGTFATEMLSLNLTGTNPFYPFMIRESPTLASTGQTSITDIGGGMYHIDSFFDVFTELSVDGGQSWIPSGSGATRMTLVPEPGAISMMLVGVALGIARRRIRVLAQATRR